MAFLLELPEALLLVTALAQRFPCREAQIRSLVTLLHPKAAPCRNLVIHGTEATGKSAVTEALLKELTGTCDLLGYALVNSLECITGRHLFERAVGRVAEALKWAQVPSRCETVAQFAVELSRMLKFTGRPSGFRFVLVFDAIDRQREIPPTLIPALARLSEIIPCLTTVFIVTVPGANFLRTSLAPHVYFPNYTKTEFVSIVAAQPPAPLPAASADETAELWTRFAGAVHDALTRSATRTLPAFIHACHALWPRFVAPVCAGTHVSREFAKLLVAARAHFQDEALLDPSVFITAPAAGITAPPVRSAHDTRTCADAGAPVKNKTPRQTADLATLLPTTARLLLLAAYLASHNAARHDLTLFSTFHHGRRRRRGGLVAGAGVRRGRTRSKHRKIARKLLGAHAFVLERMLAIFAALRSEWAGVAPPSSVTIGGGEDMDADVGMAIVTLASLRMLIRAGAGATTGGGDTMDRGGKWRVNVSWEVVRGLGRGMGLEIEEWLID